MKAYVETGRVIKKGLVGKCNGNAAIVLDRYGKEFVIQNEFFSAGDNVPYYWFDVEFEKEESKRNIVLKFERDCFSRVDNGVRNLYFIGEMPWISINNKSDIHASINFVMPTKLNEMNLNKSNFHLEGGKL